MNNNAHQANPSTFTITRDLLLDIPPSRAWELVADYRLDTQWRQGVERMEPFPAGLVEVGTTTSEDMRFGGRTYHNDGEVVAVDPGRRFEWRTTSGADACGSRTVEPVGHERCRVVLELTVTPSGAERLMAPVLRRMLGRQLAGDLRRLAALATRHPETTSV